MNDKDHLVGQLTWGFDASAHLTDVQGEFQCWILNPPAELKPSHPLLLPNFGIKIVYLFRELGP